MAIKTTTPAAKKAATTKKVAAKKVATKKVAAKKVAAKKTATKTAPAKTASLSKVEPAKTPAPKKTAAKKVAPATKAAPVKKVLETKIVARVDVGFGNQLYIRGEGAGLSWDKGTLLENVSPYEWVFSTTAAKTGIVFKFTINDEVWADGENLSVSAGGTSITSPSFN